MKGGRAQASQYAPAWQGSPYNRKTGNRRVALSLAAEVVRAMMGEQQQAKRRDQNRLGVGYERDLRRRSSDPRWPRAMRLGP